MSISTNVAFCIEALEEELARYGKPSIFNTDQGSQFTSAAFTAVLHCEEIAISMDGKGCWRDHTLKVKLVHQCRLATQAEARHAPFGYIEGYYNRHRMHSALAYLTLEQAEQSMTG